MYYLPNGKYSDSLTQKHKAWALFWLVRFRIWVIFAQDVMSNDFKDKHCHFRAFLRASQCLNLAKESLRAYKSSLPDS